MPTTYSWGAETHKNIVEYVYLSLSLEAQAQLDLEKLKEGAVMPDRDFKDFRKHHYPQSLEEAEKWLNGDGDLSLNIGIASHYITDSFSAPHTVSGENYHDHSKFEKQVTYYYPNVECRDYNFNLEDLKSTTKNSKDWKEWLENKNKKIPQQEVDEATKFLFSIVLGELNATCNNIKTEVITKPYINNGKIIAISIVLLASIFLLKN